MSHCETDSTYDGRFIQGVIYNKPGDTSYDLGNCPNNRRQIANFTVGDQAPQFANAVLRAVASDWRVSGILNAQSGNWLTVTTGAGYQLHRPHRPAGEPGDRQSVRRQDAEQLSQPAAFAYPASGEYWDLTRRGSSKGPAYWNVNMALARVVPVGDGRTLELRVEAFNLLNHFNWGDPATNLDAGTFGRITTQAGNSRIMQFAVSMAFE